MYWAASEKNQLRYLILLSVQQLFFFIKNIINFSKDEILKILAGEVVRTRLCFETRELKGQLRPAGEI